VHDVPRFGLDPFGWLAAAERIAGERKADLLFPTQEQVTVLEAPEYVRATIEASPALRWKAQNVKAWKSGDKSLAPRTRRRLRRDP
jgi:hypothetical protein